MSAPDGLRQALESALVENPDDLAAHRAYADLLAEQGDPCGDFIAVQLALEDGAPPAEARARLQQREQALLAEHGRAWLGAGLASYLIDNRVDDLPDYYARRYQRGKLSFARGWLDRLQIRFLSPALAAVLADSPAVRLLRALDLWRVGEPAECFPTLAQSTHLGNLRLLEVGADDDRGNTSALGVEELVRRLPRLEELVLLAHEIDTDTLFALPLPHLRKLQVYHVHHYPLELLAANASLGRLTHLLLQPHALEPRHDRAYITLEGVRALVHSPHLKSLTHLELKMSDMGDAGVEEVVRSGILARLKSLTLGPGRITDSGALLLAGCPELRRLELLDLHNNRLGEEGVALLQATGVRLVADAQRDPPDPEYGEDEDREYLCEGDWE
jgi:uncharacterized protein (TIGR02996 family)